MRGIVVEQTFLDAPLELVEGTPTSLVVVDGMEEPTLAIAECGRLLVSNRGRAVDVDELIRNKIFTAGQRGRYRAAICELRRRLGPAARLIQTVPGFGYRFDVAERYREPS